VPTCINLKRQLGRRYRIEYEESYFAQYGPHARVEDPWLMIVPGRYGHIFPHGGNLLAASVDGHPNVAGALRKLQCCRVHQDGDFGEVTVLFEVGDFDKVAKIIRPRRRRQVSAQERHRLQGMGFKKGSQAHVDGEPTARTCVPEPKADLGAVAEQEAPFSPQRAQ
jgi:hypothetical protein